MRAPLCSSREITSFRFRGIEARGGKRFNGKMRHIRPYSRVVNGTDHPEQMQIRNFRDRKFVDEQSEARAKRRISQDKHGSLALARDLRPEGAFHVALWRVSPRAINFGQISSPSASEFGH